MVSIGRDIVRLLLRLDIGLPLRAALESEVVRKGASLLKRAPISATLSVPGAKARPRILGALCDAVSAALRNVDKMRIERSPRMADFVKWIAAAEPGLGRREGTATELLRELNNRVAERIRNARRWPETAQSLGNRIDSIAPLLRAKRFAVERMRSTARTIKVIPPSA